MKTLPKYDMPKAKNPDAVRNAIEILTMVKEKELGFNMSLWHTTTTPMSLSGVKKLVAENLDEAHKCGSVCCMAGWVALTPHFQQEGTVMTASGAPLYHGEKQDRAIAKYFGIPNRLARALTAYTFDEEIKKCYGTEYHAEITLDMVLQRLWELL